MYAKLARVHALDMQHLYQKTETGGGEKRWPTKTYTVRLKIEYQPTYQCLDPYFCPMDLDDENPGVECSCLHSTSSVEETRVKLNIQADLLGQLDWYLGSKPNALVDRVEERILQRERDEEYECDAECKHFYRLVGVRVQSIEFVRTLP
jgi:hypothetical protein